MMPIKDRVVSRSRPCVRALLPAESRQCGQFKPVPPFARTTLAPGRHDDTRGVRMGGIHELPSPALLGAQPPGALLFGVFIRSVCPLVPVCFFAARCLLLPTARRLSRSVVPDASLVPSSPMPLPPPCASVALEFPRSPLPTTSLSRARVCLLAPNNLALSRACVCLLAPALLRVPPLLPRALIVSATRSRHGPRQDTRLCRRHVLVVFRAGRAPT